MYDGDCGFCTSSARFLMRWIPVEADVEPWQVVDLDTLGIDQRRVEHELVWVAVDGRTAGGAQAVAAYLLAAGGPWRLVGKLLRLPPIRWIAAGVYRLIANNRHRLPGGTPACALRRSGTNQAGTDPSSASQGG